jgi:hypothetical protein
MRHRPRLSRPAPARNIVAEALEPRALLAAPEVSDLRFDLGRPPRMWETTVVSVAAADDEAVRAVVFFLDRDRDGGWTPNVDEPLGEVFTPSQDGRYRVSVTPDHSWPNDPAAPPRIIADAVDAQGEWSDDRGVLEFAPDAPPRVTALQVVVVPNSQNPNLRQITLYAAVSDNFGISTGVRGVTFFIDADRSGTWTPGVDTDMGFSTTQDARGYYLRTFTQNGPAPELFGAAAQDTNPQLPNQWGPVASATALAGDATAFNAPAAFNSVTWTNVSRPGEEPTYGDRVRLDFIADAPRDLLAATLFFDNNLDRQWTPGNDIDLGVQFFEPGILRGRGAIEFTVTPAMNFSYRAFVLTVKDRSGNADNEWGPTLTTFVPIVSPPWLESLTPSQPSFGGSGSVVVDFVGRDDAGVRSVMAWLDRDNNGRFDQGEAAQMNATRLSTGATSSNWRATVSLAGAPYAPGVYRLYLIASDYQGALSAPAFTAITIA